MRCGRNSPHDHPHGPRSPISGGTAAKDAPACGEPVSSIASSHGRDSDQQHHLFMPNISGQERLKRIEEAGLLHADPLRERDWTQTVLKSTSCTFLHVIHPPTQSHADVINTHHMGYPSPGGLWHARSLGASLSPHCYQRRWGERSSCI